MANKKLRATEIFTPGDFPKFTYVARQEAGFEKRLRESLETPGEVISVSGPSKSGKTVLIEKVIGVEKLITVNGSRISTPDDLWNRVLDWMDVPASTTVTETSSSGMKASVEASGQAGVVGLANAGVKGAGGLTTTRATSTTAVQNRGGLTQVVREIADSEYVLFLDDFHYIPRPAQADIAKAIKEAARLRVKIVAASVPHRTDDVVRSNPELRGRTRAVDLSYWSIPDLVKIASLGFQRLGIDLEAEVLAEFATESSGSPQLMQAIGLQTCFELDVREERDGEWQVRLSKEQRDKIYQECATRTDYSSLVTNMHNGPKKRGTERKEFDFFDGTSGDVYRCVLLALAENPPRLGFAYNELYNRIQGICKGGSVPQAAGIYQACSQISKFADNMYPNQRVVEWTEDSSRIDIVDPYFLFFLRWSCRLDELAES